MSQLTSLQDERSASWLPRLAAHGGPRFLQIADALQQAVADGLLKSGDRLPPQRQLAAQLDVDLTTVTRAYDEAKRRHLLEGRVLMRADSGLLMSYHLGGGSESDREAGARWMAPMFGRVDPRQVIVCPGAQAAIAALILTLTAPDDVILVEPTGYPGLRAAATQFGRRIVTVGADRHGMLPERLEQACREHAPRLVYLNPTLQNPTTVTMPAQRRQELAAIARHAGVRIVEDDPYWLLAEAPPPPIATCAPSHAYYISSLSKCLTPGLRIAFVLVPDPLDRERLLVALRSFALMAPPLAGALATQWILDGSAARLLEGVRTEARIRHRMARNILAGRYTGAGDGLHVWLELPAYWNGTQLARAADKEGMAVAPGEAFANGSDSVNAIRISLGCVRDRGRLQTGLQRLSQLLARRPECSGTPPA